MCRLVEVLRRATSGQPKSLCARRRDRSRCHRDLSAQDLRRPDAIDHWLMQLFYLSAQNVDRNNRKIPSFVAAQIVVELQNYLSLRNPPCLHRCRDRQRVRATARVLHVQQELNAEIQSHAGEVTRAAITKGRLLLQLAETVSIDL